MILGFYVWFYREKLNKKVEKRVIFGIKYVWNFFFFLKIEIIKKMKIFLGDHIFHIHALL